MIEIKDIAWLAGLTEGEGCFAWQGCTANITINMTDRDVVERASVLFKSNLLGPYHPKQPHVKKSKDIWRTTACGQRAIGWMMTLYPLMGERRKFKIEEVLHTWKTRTPQWPNPVMPFGGHPTCHPERKHWARGLCHSCHGTMRRKMKREMLVNNGE